MSAETNELMSAIERSQEQSAKLAEKIFSAAQPNAVYGEPLVSGAYTVITASEVGAGGGWGFGGGIGPSAGAAAQGASGTEPEPRQPRGSGGGGGGGSKATAVVHRPTTVTPPRPRSAE